MLCNDCGFVFSNPRPDEADMRLKYEKIVEYRTSEISPLYNRSFDNSRRRSRELKCLLQNFVSLTGMRILDFGGAEGKVLSSLVTGNECFVIDYEQRQLVDGVKYLGQALSDLGHMKVDIITACHVLEHMVSPREFLLEAKNYLSKNGLLYVEVPMELRKNFSGHGDFITHINVFSSGTLDELLVKTGFTVVESSVKSKPNNNGWELVAYALARNSGLEKAREANPEYSTEKSLTKRWLAERLKGRAKYEFFSLFDRMRSNTISR